MFSILRSSIIKSTSPFLSRNISNEVLPNAIKPSNFSIATLRSFPSLEPHSIFPVHNKILNVPLRRDILWLAVVMELDNRRVGASNPPGRSEHKFSRKKLFKQKGTGRARVGDGNSPIRFRGAYALARTAPNDFSTDLPNKVYYYAYRIALSDAYRKGKLNIIGKDEDFINKYKEKLSTNDSIKAGDSFDLEIPTTESIAISKFVKSHDLEKLNTLFIADDYFKVSNLREAILRYPSNKLTVLQKDEVEVRDLLKANKIIIEKSAFDYFAAKYTKFVDFDA
ncbi:54S ribosomal protein, mitochondrial [Pichia californica]|uniref:Large ribosomal subunit protein uL4m n=1 Tax=Pichia californica TaxID=460514 RepID=A0A9P6WH70_9ASCO|nr:54S ribosomal protein, mitochondrial [[Candida] californica]KAG0686892.1 54S ribosomal protein, mitochondrial [[Candida] californica]